MYFFDDKSSTTEMITVAAAGCLAVFFAIACLVFFFLPLDTIDWTQRWPVLAFVVIISFIIFVFLYVISALIRKLIARRSLLSRCKCLSLIGYGGITLCTIAPRILVFFFLGKDIYMNWYIAFFSVVTSFLIYCLILRPGSKHLENYYSMDGTASWLWKHLLAHIIVLIVTIRIAIALFEDGNDRGAVILCHFLYSFICAPSIFDFCQVLRGGVNLRNNNNTNNSNNINGDYQMQGLVTANVEMGIPKKTKASEPKNKFKLECENCKKNNQNRGFVAGNKKKGEAVKVPENNLKLECKICMLEYSETRIPRMLKECGHTVCEKCADELLKKNNQRYLCCPFCQEMTSVKGPANLLPKNYALLEAVEKMK